MAPSVDILMPPEPMTLCHDAKGFQDSPPPTVPTGWPTFLNSPLAWSGTQLRDESLFTHALDDMEKEEISKALLHFKGQF